MTTAQPKEDASSRNPQENEIPSLHVRDFSFEGLNNLVTGIQIFRFGEALGEHQENKSETNQQIY